MEASTFLNSASELKISEQPTQPKAVAKQGIELPQLLETPPYFLSLAHCRTAVHALKALELALEEQHTENAVPQLRVLNTVSPYIIDLGALLFGKRQLGQVRQLLDTFGFRLKGLLSTSPVSIQAAYALGIVLLEAETEPEEQPEENSKKTVSTDTPALAHEATPLRRKDNMSQPALPLVSRKELAQRAMGRQGAVGAEAAAVSTLSTLYVKSTLRSGRFVDYDGHVVLLGDAHPGSEIRATGDILVWGALRGLAHAGQKGNRKAEIRALRLDALQLRIADLIARRPDQWSNAAGSVSSPEPQGSQAANLGELARVLEGEIQIVSAYATVEGGSLTL